MISFSALLVVSFLSLSEESWPDGQYCLPMPRNHPCPSGWESGYRFHDTNDNSGSSCYNKRYGYFPRIFRYCKDLEWGFCCKTSTRSSYSHKTSWPRGHYCIFQRGGRCPTGFDQGYIFWDDEDTNNANANRGSLPDGVYNSETKIYFCCRNDASSFLPCRAIISGLPKCRELILMRYMGSCPALSGYRGPHSGFLEWDTENSGNRDAFVGAFPDGVSLLSRLLRPTRIKIQFCGYTSDHSCRN